VAVEADDHKMPRGKDGGGSAQALQRETRKGFQQNRKACDDEQRAKRTKSGEIQERRMVMMPTENPSRHKSYEGSGGKHKKDRSSKNGG
jgi:hypothetical protein